ncbi:MAG: hypothetical protein KJP02_12785 [Octadecabacter sp.]|nr:hypothetical protein [Octadecabacter sp.]
MSRVLITLTLTALLLMGVTALAIRWELAAPGLSLFINPDGHAGGHLFETTVLTHTILSNLAVLLCGTTMIAIARDHRVPLTGLLMWTGIALAAVIILVALLAGLPPLGGTGTPQTMQTPGWSLYPPLSTGPTSLLSQLLPSVDPLFLGYYLGQIALPANAALYLGVYALAATLPKSGWTIFVGLFTVLAAVGFTTGAIAAPSGFDAAWVVALGAPFLVCAGYHLIFQPAAWLVVLTMGMIITTAVPTLLGTLPDAPALGGTTAITALQYIAPMGLAWFALPALLMFLRPVRLGAAVLTTLAITVALFLWLAPLFLLGRIGMPMRYPDYPVAFASLNLATSLGVAAFTLIYPAILIAIRRTGA